MPRVRRMAEYLGQSYFDYLSGLKDLVLIMDEAHRYRANAGMAAINELHPVLGSSLQRPNQPEPKVNLSEILRMSIIWLTQFTMVL